MKLIDLSVPISPQIREPLPAGIQYSTHEDGAQQAAAALGLKQEDFPEGKAWATETVTLNTHAGTHIDAPWHYWPTSEGQPARTIDEMPLEWFYSDGVLLDFSSKPPGYEITTEDLIAELDRIGYTLKPFDIVLIRSDADKRLYHEHYAFLHAGVSAEATLWLLDQGIKVVGTDGWGWDIPLNLQAEAYKQNPREGVLWRLIISAKTVNIARSKNWPTWIRFRSHLASKSPASPSKWKKRVPAGLVQLPLLNRYSEGWKKPATIVAGSILLRF